MWDEGIVGRRGLLAVATGMVTCGWNVPLARSKPVEGAQRSASIAGHGVLFADLTHRLTREFNFDPANPRLAMTSVDGSGAKAGMIMHRLSLIEHTGTHIDAPSHFGEGYRSLGDIPLSDLIVPLAVIDIRRRAATSRNAEVEPQDILEWEKQHGRLPNGCCVAMLSGANPVSDMALVRLEGRYLSAGFSVAATHMLITERDVKGIAVDSMTLDAGINVPSYPVHQEWLRSGRWGIEGIANLDSVPAAGALLVVGAAPIADATGLPVRAIAFF